MSDTDDDTGALGILTPDSARTVLVISADGELSVALRDRIDRAYALVKDVRPDEALSAFATCIPWPWMVVGNVAELGADVIEAMQDRPILVYWRGPAPDGLPRHTRHFERFNDLAAAVNNALTQNVSGLKLAVGLGVDLPDGSFARSAELQALVANHPHAFDVPLDAFRSAARVLATHNIHAKPVRDNESGSVRLVEGAGVLP
jgi:hypothetical protein